MSKTLVVKSPLKAWPGGIELPNPNDYSGVHWQTWKESINRPTRKAYALTHLYCYAGLELIQTTGGWNFKIPLAEVQAWETNPADERIKLVAWLGRAIMRYMDDIMDPKE